jgi:hypothetical protein
LPALPHGFIYKLTVSEYSRLCIEWQVAALQARRARQGRACGMQGNPNRKIYQEMASWPPVSGT